MPKRTSYEPGTPSFVDLMSPDVEASQAFYTGLFGWTADVVEDNGTRVYALLRKDGLSTAGLGGQPPDMAGAPPVWNSYITVADAAEAVAKIEKAGGRIMMPVMQVFDAGKMAVAADPTGAMFSIWEPMSSAGAEIVNEPDTYSWNELLTADIDAAKSFYSDVFGWTYEGMDMGPGGMYWVIQGGEAGGLGGMMARPEMLPAQVPDHWAVYFIVSDIAAKLEATTAAGGQVMFGPEAIPGVGKVATAADPQGGQFSLLQPEAAAG